MGVVIEICIKYPGGRTPIKVTGILHAAVWRATTVDIPAGGGQAGIPAGAIAYRGVRRGPVPVLRMGIHAYAVGYGG